MKRSVLRPGSAGPVETPRSLDAFLKPRGVAVVGVSRKPDKLGHIILRNLRDGGFAGELYAVNPKGGRILDTATYTEIGGIPNPVDLAVLAVPAEAVPEMARQCGEAGVRAIVVVAAGFREIGGDGAAREAELRKIVRRYGMQLLGPNCLGLIDTRSKLNASFAGSLPPAGPVAVLSQSGAMGTAILDWAAGDGAVGPRRLPHRNESALGFSTFISLGNESDLTEADWLPVLETDQRTSVVLGYLEEITDGQAFVIAASRLTRVKPMILLAPGRTGAGASAAASHTGALTGSGDATAAACRRAGIIQVQTIQELFDYTSVFARSPRPSGGRVAIVTNAGGPGVVATDAVSDAPYLDVAALSDRTRAALRNVLPDAAGIGNPVDVIGDARANRYQMALSAVLADRGVDAVIVLLTPQAMTEVTATADVIIRAARGSRKPVLPVFIGGPAVAPGVTRLTELGIPVFPSPDRAVAALSAAAGYAVYRSHAPRRRQRGGTPKRATAAALRTFSETDRREVGGIEAAAVVKPYGIETPKTIQAADSDDAVAAAQKVGYPVAVKIDSPDILHKTDVGGVRLDLATPEAVTHAFDEIRRSVAAKSPEAELRGVTVSPMLPAEGVDLLIGAKRDRSFGPILTVGQGGIFVEGIGDVTHELAPVAAADAAELLARTRIGKLLAGARGSSFDAGAAVKAIQAVSQMMLDNPDISELEFNPFRVFARGGWALDIRLVLS